MKSMIYVLLAVLVLSTAVGEASAKVLPSQAVVFPVAADRSGDGKSNTGALYAPTLPNDHGADERLMFERFLDGGIAFAGIDASANISCNPGVGKVVDHEKVLRRVADAVVGQTTCRLLDRRTGQTFMDSASLEPAPEIRIESKFNAWFYQTWLLADGMRRAAGVLDDPVFRNYGERNLDFIFRHMAFFEKQHAAGMRMDPVGDGKLSPIGFYFKIDALWHTGLAPLVMERHAETKDPRYEAYLERVTRFLETCPRFEDGAFYRAGKGMMTDDPFMTVPFLLRKWQARGDARDLDLAIAQILGTHDRLFDRGHGLLRHLWDLKTKQAAGVFWGRGNGWMVLAHAELLAKLPREHPRRADVLAAFVRHMEGIRSCQDAAGGWHQVLDHPESWIETSCTGMFVYGLARGVNEGWLDESFREPARKGWEALKAKVTTDGDLIDVCGSTDVGDLPFYLNRPRLRGDLHGFGSFLLAGAEILRMEKSSADTGFREAEENSRLAAEAFFRSRKYVNGWLAHADPKSGLIPRNMKDRYWNGRDAAADNYSFMVLTAAMTDRTLLEGRLTDMLRTESRLTRRVDSLPDNFLFSSQSWQRPDIDRDAMIFDGAEYAKDGLLYITEWMGRSPWTERMIGMVDDIWKNPAVETPFGRIPTRNFEVNGDLLQVCSRLYWFTGERKYLDWAVRIGDYFLLGANHPTRDSDSLTLGDHSCEVINGLSELYLTVSRDLPEKREAYRKPIHELFDRILQTAVNGHGMMFKTVNPKTGEVIDKDLTDNWGYNYDGFYTVWLVDGTNTYRDAVRKALSNLKTHYTGQIWERGSSDGYADSIEGAITLLNREAVPSAFDWVDSEIRTMWAKQKPDGIIEGWHGDGNFARTSLMYALLKTQGCRLEPWREDLRIGAHRDGKDLRLFLSAEKPWSGKLVFDHPRHRDVMKLPIDYPRINQFPEWFTLPKGKHPEGFPMALEPNTPRKARVSAEGEITFD